MKGKIQTGLLALTAAMCVSFNASADWQLNNDQSSVNFISTKKAKVSEIHTFKSVGGAITDAGKANIEIQLASVDTNIGIRNERMQAMLFEVSKFATANISAAVDATKATNLKAGESFTTKTKLDINLHGKTVSADAELRAVKLASGQLAVSTIKPLLINAADFELVEGIEKLREVAKLPSISTAVPVTVDLVFDKK
ncbi:YceI family protein [Litoribacillus peritrichatus]|uniref:Lipid/polyisoprenoid-binding YceI-like domain-containing protein n=1 Tax=Litoribacillus peritrichatus TaxID=718191 RepID=A0ABP7M7R2_9GAMM